MNITQWQPFRDMDEMINRMVPALTRWRGETNGEDAAWAPTADISETDKEYLVRAELPGVKREDVKVTVEDGMLTLSGERKREREEKNERFHRVDPARIHLTGLSMGGFATWSIAVNHPKRFATVVPICGGGNPVAVRRMARNRAADLKELNVWAFHGAKDPTVALSETESMVGALKQAGVPRVQFTVYPEAKHDSWTETYANPALYEWLLQQRR